MFSRRQFIKTASVSGLALTMSDIALKASTSSVMTQSSQKNMTPDKALEELIKGNQRITSRNPIKRDLLSQAKETSAGQYPFASIISCLDSRTQPEYIFDRGIGDILVGRIAANFVNTDLLGSLEFAAAIVGSKLIVVLGHTECGAVKGACDNVILGNLTQTLSNIMPAVYAVNDIKGERNSSNNKFVQRGI